MSAKQLPTIKTCTSCLEDKPLNEFPITNKSKGYLSSQCKVCTKIRQREWCENRNSAILPSTKICTICKIKKNIEEFGWQTKRLNLKLAACKLCINIKQTKYAQSNKGKISIKNSAVKQQLRKYFYLGNHPCVDCGETDVRLLEFDHVRGEKLFNLATGNIRRKSFETEVAKCDIRCRHCHSLRHFNERDNTPSAIAYKIFIEN